MAADEIQALRDTMRVVGLQLHNLVLQVSMLTSALLEASGNGGPLTRQYNAIKDDLLSLDESILRIADSLLPEDEGLDGITGHE